MGSPACEGRRRGGTWRVGVAAAASVVAALCATACAAQTAGGRAGKPAPAHRAAPRAASPAAPRAIYSVVTDKRELALTYDDGPGAGETGTPAILAILRAHGARATFFALGEEVVQRPQVVHDLAAAGMEVENHGQRHANMAQLGPQALQRVIADGASTIAKETHAQPLYLRPPFGSQSARVRSTAQAAGERVVIWSVDTRDWANPGVATIVQRVLQGAAPGAVILLHDGGADRSQTVAATRQIVPSLQGEGYRLVTLRQLIADGTPAGMTGQPLGEGATAAPAKRPGVAPAATGTRGGTQAPRRRAHPVRRRPAGA